MTYLDPEVPWTPPTAEEQARLAAEEAAANARWQQLDRREQIRQQCELEARELYGDLDAEGELEPEPDASDVGRFEPTPYDLGITDDPEVTWLEIHRDDPEAGLGHDYDGPELRSGTPEYEALYAEYQAWASQPGPQADNPAASSALWAERDAFLITTPLPEPRPAYSEIHASSELTRLPLAEPEPEAEL